MIRSEKSWVNFVFIAFSCSFPFFEGGEAPAGLLILHSLILGTLAVLVVSQSSILIPRFLKPFLPFLLTLFICFLLAPYKFSAFLELLDVLMASTFAVVVAGLLRALKEKEGLHRLPMIIFFVIFSGIAISLLTTDAAQWPRLRADFLNPNNFATFLLLLLLLGYYALEQESSRSLKRLLIVMCSLVFLGFLLTYSRSGFVACAAIVMMYLWKQKARRRMMVLGTLIILVAGGALFLRFVQTPDPFQYYRLKIWKHSVGGISENPYLGIGLNMLIHTAPRLNFPADVELGRYARIARTADNQFVQILTETGFLGLFTFLVGWIGLFLILRKLPDQFFVLRQAYLVISISAFFSLPLSNTSILLLFLFLIVFALCAANQDSMILLRIPRLARIALPLILIGIFVVAVYLPFIADFYQKKGYRSRDPQSANRYFQKAIRSNPYQPYYKFSPVKRIVDARPELTTDQWTRLIQVLNQSIELNPLESDFYVYRARIFRALLKKTRNANYYSLAISSYHSALDCSPYNAFLHVEFASFLLEEGRVDLAETEIRKAIELEPAYLTARLLLAELLFRLNNPEDARKEYSAFERYYNRYVPQEKSIQPDYARALIGVNEQQKKRVANMLSVE